MRPKATLAALALLAGCATGTRPQISNPGQSFPADALITQRAILTVRGREFTLNGYLARSATQGQRLVIAQNIGGVLADVLIKPDGQVYVVQSSALLKPQWIKDFVAADVTCIFGGNHPENCPGQRLATNRFLIERRWYKLDLHIVDIKPGLQPVETFAAPSDSQQ